MILERNGDFENICRHLKIWRSFYYYCKTYGYFDNVKKSFSLQVIQNHKYSNILENIGEKDISSHVNFND